MWPWGLVVCVPGATLFLLCLQVDSDLPEVSTGLSGGLYVPPLRGARVVERVFGHGDVSRTFHRAALQFLSSAQGMNTRTDHVLGHKVGGN